MLKHAELTEITIGAFYAVYSGLGYGFLEKVYENALAHELTRRGLRVKQQERIFVHYDGRLVGDYYADILVEEKIILELKATEELNEAFTAQLMNYLKATKCEVGYVLNFGPEPKYERRYFSNERKKHGRTNPRQSVQSA
ncbi:MAG: GxxExxY protein [Chloroflexi bacterium]|nr:MAG: GxxExxY protein [Chloroflexota bacterium]